MPKLLAILLFSLICSISCTSTTGQKYNIQAAHINAKLGLAYLQLNQVTYAKGKLLNAFKQAPYDATVHMALGSFFAHTGEPQLAEKHYLCALKYADTKGGIWHEYGVFLSKQKRYREGLKYFLLAAQDMNYLFVAQAYVDAGNVALRLHQNELSKEYFRSALLHDPSVFPKNLFKNSTNLAVSN